MTGNELKPCPFCGGEASIRHQDVYMSKAIFVHCQNCKARVMEYYEGVHGFGDAKRYQTEEEATGKAIKAWNKRAPDQKVSAALYDQEEIHHNCTVQILSNSVTGDVSIGWWPEDRNPYVNE